jgi:DNA invertase Pin-like site-specific DNA recombinase
LIFHIFAAIAEFERDLIRERTQAGLKAAGVRGRLGGRPTKLCSSQIQRLHTLMKDPSLSIAELQKMFAIGKSSLYRYRDKNVG